MGVHVPSGAQTRYNCSIIGDVILDMMCCVATEYMLLTMCALIN